VLTEQEASHCGVSFQKRFDEALGYYAAVYDSLDAASAERAGVECAVLGDDSLDVRLREGNHRRERHDRLQRTYVTMRQGNNVLNRCGLSGCAVPASRELDSPGPASRLRLLCKDGLPRMDGASRRLPRRGHSGNTCLVPGCKGLNKKKHAMLAMTRKQENADKAVWTYDAPFSDL